MSPLFISWGEKGEGWRVSTAVLHHTLRLYYPLTSLSVIESGFNSRRPFKMETKKEYCRIKFIDEDENLQTCNEVTKCDNCRIIGISGSCRKCNYESMKFLRRDTKFIKCSKCGHLEKIIWET